MKHLNIFLDIFLVTFFLIASSFSVFIPKAKSPESYESNVNWVKQVTRQYSPHSWTLLDQYEKLPLKQEINLREGLTISVKKPVNTFHYLSGKNRAELLLSMSTNVHEISHAFFRANSLKYAKEEGIQLNWDNAEGFIYLTPSDHYFVSVPRNILFPSKKLAAVIPLKMKTFRFETYIKGNTSTQDEGIIGLLNEFHAYYLGSRYTFEMLDAYKISDGNVKGFHHWVSHSQSTMSSFYEFDYFIREYLLYMKENHSDDYAYLKSNLAFRKALSGVHIFFGKLVKTYEELVYKQMELLNESKAGEAVIEEEMLWVTPKGSKIRMGTTIFSEDKDKLVTLLQTDRYKAIEKDFY